MLALSSPACGAADEQYFLRQERDIALLRRAGYLRSAASAPNSNMLRDHGVGFAAANPMRFLAFHPKSRDVLEAGMTFNIEPAIYVDGVVAYATATLSPARRSGRKFLRIFSQGEI